MIVGKIKFTSNDEDALYRLRKIAGWQTTRHHAIESGIFFADILLHESFPGLSEDLYYKDPESGDVLIIDGYIYNKAEFIIFPQEHTAKLLWLLYKKYGEKFVAQLNGDFAICIYHAGEKKLILIRDHLGIRPLALAKKNGCFYWGTDKKGLCKAVFENEPVSQEYLAASFLFHTNLLLPHTDAWIIKPGHYVVITAGSYKEVKYWFPEKIRVNHKISFQSAIKDLKELLSSAIAARCDKNFAGSAHVSGGLDSGMVAALARQNYAGQPFFAFTWSPDFDRIEKLPNDERERVQELCAKYDMKPVFSNFDQEDFDCFISYWRYNSEMIFEKKVSEAARDRGVNLIFSGWGGDEFLSIGNVGVDADIVRSLDWDKFITKYPLNNPRKILIVLLTKILLPGRYLTVSKYKTYPQVHRYLKKVIKNNTYSRRERYRYSSRKKTHLQLLYNYHLSSRCEDWYVHGQRSGIEYRYPLLDKCIIEYMLQLPSRIFVQSGNNRIFIRKIAEDFLPESITALPAKDDPAKDKLLFSFGIDNQFLDELDSFAANKELSFFDFNLLRDDIKKEMEILGKASQETNWALLWLKTTHEFTEQYHSPDIV